MFGFDDGFEKLKPLGTRKGIPRGSISEAQSLTLERYLAVFISPVNAGSGTNLELNSETEPQVLKCAK